MRQLIADQPGEAAIEAYDLWRVYKIGAREVPALRGVQLRIPEGRFVALTGRSG